MTIGRILRAASAFASKCPIISLGAHRFVLDFPTVVIGYEIHRGKRNLGLSRQLGLRQIRHADDIEAHFPMKLRLRSRRKGGSVHVHISSSVMNGVAQCRGFLSDDRPEICAHRIGKADVGNDSISEECPIRAPTGPIKELRRKNNVSRRIFLFETADSAHAKNPSNI